MKKRERSHTAPQAPPTTDPPLPALVEPAIAPLVEKAPDARAALSVPERDISPRPETTEALAAEAMFRGLLEAAPDAMVIARADGTIAIVNSQLKRMFGYEHEELVGRPIEALVPARFHDAHIAHRARYSREPRTRSMGAGLDLRARRKDGTEFAVEISLSPMSTSQGTRIAAAIRDISERKRVETRLRTSLAEKEVLLREIHHRVKNNLQIVSSMLSLQMEQVSDSQALELFKESQSRVRSIALFHERLYESKDLARVDIPGYLASLALGLFGTYGVDPDHIVLSVNAEDVPLGVDAAISCGLIINELLSNALKHAFPDGRKGQVKVGLQRRDEQAILVIEDDGVGFPADVDYQRPRTLGLKLVSILAEQLGGAVELERQRGTRFVIRFDPGACS